MKEIWKDIPGYEGLYQVSSLGNIKSLDRHVCDNRGYNKLYSKKLTPFYNGRGYLKIGLSKNNKRMYFRVNRLVAESFVPNPDNNPHVNHKNGIKEDNRASNLEWVSISENLKHAYRVLKRMPARLGKFGADNPTSKPVVQKKDGIIIASFSAAKEAERATGISQGNISKCARGGSKSAGGYQWEYINK